jgi:hypothetical protein
VTFEQAALFALPADQECEQPQALQVERMAEQPAGRLGFDGRVYVYDGYVIDGDTYVKKHLTFTPDEAGVFADCELERVRLMVDAVGRDSVRQAEIRAYGKRIWHSVVRPEAACSQALDWAFGHHVARVAHCLPHVEQLFRDDPLRADLWIQELHSAYILWCQGERESLYRALRQAGVPKGFL